MDYIQHCASPLGGILLAGAGDRLVGLWFDGQSYFGEGLDPEHEAGELPVLDEGRRWLEMYFAGEKPDFTPPVAPRGTDFQRAVWAILSDIPYGRTATYGELARALADMGRPNASPRAVGGAVARNPISLIVPCHRVIGANGDLTGYAGGLDRKRRLLALEEAAIKAFDSGKFTAIQSCAGRRDAL